MCEQQNNFYYTFHNYGISGCCEILFQIVCAFISHGWLVITATLLQNSLKELFVLLNLIYLEIFVDYADLDSSCDQLRGRREV